MRPPCFDCGFLSVEDHHVVPRSLGGTKTVPLCSDCHGKVHNVSRLNISALTKRALKKLKDEGRSLGGEPPFGYKNVDGLRVPDDDEQKVIQKIQNWRRNRFSQRTIVEFLIADNVPCRGQKWHATSVARILRENPPPRTFK